MKYFVSLVFLASVFSIPVLGAGSVATMPTRAEIETELATVDQKQAEDVLHAMDPSRDYEVLVKVTLDPQANWDELQETPGSDENYLPGTIRKNVEITKEMRERVFQTLPKKREVLVLTPKDVPGTIEKAASGWISRKLSLKSTDVVQFQPQIQAREPASVPPPESFVGSRDYWRAIIVAGAFLGAIILLCLFIIYARTQKKSKEKSVPPSPEPSSLPEKKEAEKTAELPAERPASVNESLLAIARIAGFNPEVSSLAFMGLIGKAGDLEYTAKIVQALGMDQALHLFPKVSGSAWVRLGTAISELKEATVTIEDCQNFTRAFNGELARMQTHAGSAKLLPTLESKGASEIANQIRSAGPARGSTLMALLSDTALTEVVPKLSTRELGGLLKGLAAVSAVPLRDIERYDRGEMLGEVQNQVLPIEAVSKVATALSALPAADDFAIFESLMATTGGSLLAQIAPYRLYPAHIASLPGEVMSSVIAARDLDNLRDLLHSVKGEARAVVMSFMTARQREAAEESAGQGGSPETLREFLNEVQGRLGASSTAEQIISIFQNVRAA